MARTQIPSPKLNGEPEIPQMRVFQGVGANNCKHLYLRRENIINGDIEYVCVKCGEKISLKRRW